MVRRAGLLSGLGWRANKTTTSTNGGAHDVTRLRALANFAKADVGITQRGATWRPYTVG